MWPKRDQWLDWFIADGAEFLRTEAPDVACVTCEGRRYTRNELLKKLSKGWRIWNSWKAKLQHIKWYGRVPLDRWAPAFLMNLSHADLRRLDLRGVDFSGTHLAFSRFTQAQLGRANFSSTGPITFSVGANLTNCDFRSAKMNRANFSGATAVGADFSRAEMQGVNFTRTNLTGAKLFRSLLAGAEFEDPNLLGTDFGGALLWESRFVNTDLSVATNLTQANFNGHCVLEHRTLLRSHQLSDAFYRGCGLPDTLIEYLPSIFEQPIQMYSCFISHSNRDEEFVKRLHADLQASDVRCWYAPRDLKIGDKTRASVDAAIRIYDKLLVVLSKDSIKSQWVEHEVEAALEEERRTGKLVLFPIRIDVTAMKSDVAWVGLIRRTRNIGDFCGWKDHDSYKAALQKLLGDLKAEKSPAPV